ncbi:alanyl-tRNA editing protein [Sporolactobacillus sp. THM7-7]|nr:alanyl-tRNA editing protein [Sporolactobacillus sp. THM7-7]
MKVKRKNGKIIHCIKERKYLEVGVAEISINWERRYTFMRYHTLLHLIAGYFYNRYQSKATSSQIKDYKARLDLQFPSSPPLDFKESEHEIQRMIKKGASVTTRTVPRNELENIPGSIKTVIDLIPRSVNDVRLVKITGIDEEACGGTHVNNISEVGEFKIIKVKNLGHNRDAWKYRLKFRTREILFFFKRLIYKFLRNSDRKLGRIHSVGNF